MSELVDFVDKQFADFMERKKQEIAQTVRDAADSILSTCYTDYGMWIATDAWTNYREHLRKELEGGLYKSVTDSEDGRWAMNVRAMIYHEHKEELVKALDQDNLLKIAELKNQLNEAYRRY